MNSLERTTPMYELLIFLMGMIVGIGVFVLTPNEEEIKLEQQIRIFELQERFRVLQASKDNSK